jgi:type I pantothenate kinase
MKCRYSILKKSVDNNPDDEIISDLASRHPKFCTDEIRNFYYPAVKLISKRRESLLQRYQSESEFFDSAPAMPPYVVSLCGSVASGKSTATALLADIFRSINPNLAVFQISTDCFLLPTAELTKRNLMGQKGFPVSYDWDAQIGFLKKLRSGEKEFQLPIYSHESYDILTDRFNEIKNPDVIFMEGLNLLQPNHANDRIISSDLTDFSIFLHMNTSDLKRFFLERVLTLSHDGQGYYRSLNILDDDEITAKATEVWNSINLPNLTEHIEPTMCRSDMIIELDSLHKPKEIRVRT